LNDRENSGKEPRKNRVFLPSPITTGHGRGAWGERKRVLVLFHLGSRYNSCLRLLTIGFFEILNMMTDNFAVYKIDNIFGYIGGLVGDTFQMP